MKVMVKRHMGNLFRFVILAGVWLFSLSAVSQPNYVVFGKVTVSQGNVLGVEAFIQTGNDISSLPVNDKGEFKSNLNWNQNYLFIFSKKGYIAKSIRFSTEIPKQVTRNTIEPYLLLVELSPVMANVDTAFFENPVGFIKFDAVINDFDFDRDYSLKVKYSAPVQRKSGDIAATQKTKYAGRNSDENNRHKTMVGNHNQTIELKKLPLRPKTLFAPDFPPLLDNYPPGITREEFSVPGRQVTRVVLNENKYLKVLLKVKHDWGGIFYFINEAPDYYRGISGETFAKLAGGS